LFRTGDIFVNAPEIGRQYSCAQCPLRCLDTFRTFTPKELAFIDGFKRGELVAEPGSAVLTEGSNSAHLYTVLSGWGFRYKLLEDGRRQILNLVMPGDFIGLQGSVLKEMQHSVEALSAMLLCVFERDRLWDLYANYPALAYDITWLAAREEQTLDEHLLSVGRRSALERLAYLLLFIFSRAEARRMTRKNTLVFPFTQQHIADTLGLSLVHTNKTLKRLSAMQLVHWHDRRFEIVDHDKLTEIAGWEPSPEAVRPLI
jgi:CRP-like cAMP-binding protein